MEKKRGGTRANVVGKEQLIALINLARGISQEEWLFEGSLRYRNSDS